MNLRIIIPARYGSTRFPGKPLFPISGVPLLQRVWALGASVVGKDRTVIATEDSRIADFCAKIGAECVMTDPSIKSGTDRVFAATQKISGHIDYIINLQGDAVLTPPWVIKNIIDEMANKSDIGIFTPAIRMTKEELEKMRIAKSKGEVGGTTVVFDRNFCALYFSKSIIPFIRKPSESTAVYRHIGLYGYKKEALHDFVNLPEGKLEQTEGLEQLRALENGMKIKIVAVDYRGRSHIGIDSEADASRAEEIIAKEGELLPSYNGSYRFQP